MGLKNIFRPGESLRVLEKLEILHLDLELKYVREGENTRIKIYDNGEFQNSLKVHVFREKVVEAIQKVGENYQQGTLK